MHFRKHFHQSLTPPPEGARRARQRPLGRFGHQREPKRAPARSQHPLGCPRTPATRAGRTGETPPSAASRHTAQCSHNAMASTMVLSHRDTADGSLQAPNCCAARPTGKPGALRLNDCHPVAQLPQTTQPLSVPRDLLGTARSSLTTPPLRTSAPCQLVDTTNVAGVFQLTRRPPSWRAGRRAHHPAPPRQTEHRPTTHRSVHGLPLPEHLYWSSTGRTEDRETLEETP